MEKPQMEFYIGRHLRESWERENEKYNAHISSLRTISCDESCRGVFVDGKEYENSKDYRVAVVPNGTGGVCEKAYPLQPVEDDLPTGFEKALKSEPVQAIMTVIMTYLTDSQRQIVYEKLGRRVAPEQPSPSTAEAIEKEAMDFADSIERRGCAYWSGMKKGFIAGRSKSIARIADLEAEVERLKESNEGLFNLLPKKYQEILKQHL